MFPTRWLNLLIFASFGLPGTAFARGGGGSSPAAWYLRAVPRAMPARSAATPFLAVLIVAEQRLVGWAIAARAKLGEPDMEAIHHLRYRAGTQEGSTRWTGTNWALHLGDAARREWQPGGRETTDGRAQRADVGEAQ